MQDAVEEFSESEKWVVFPHTGYPAKSTDPRAPAVTFPQEVLEFYAVCGGVESVIDCDADVPLLVLPPDQVKWAPPEILGRALDKQLHLRTNIVWSWYIIGRGDTDEYFCIDLAPERLGRCYYTTVYFFAQPDLTPTVAYSFSEFLEQLFSAAQAGEDWSWNAYNIGDAQ